MKSLFNARKWSLTLKSPPIQASPGIAMRRVARVLLSTVTFALIWAGGVGTAYSFGVATYVQLYELGCGTCGQPGDISAQDPSAPDLHFSSLFFPNSDVYSLSGPTYASALLSIGSPLGGIGSAAADLAAGTLSVYASPVGSPGHIAQMDSIAGFSDTLTPQADGTVHFDIDISGTKNPGASVIIGDAHIDGGIFFAIDNVHLKGPFGEYDADGCISGSSFGPPGSLFGPVQCHYEFDVLATAGVPFRFTLALDGTASNSILDLEHTLTLQVTGVPFTSDSGVFLTAAPAPVPEPATVWLFGSGLLGLIGIVRRHRRTAH